MGNEALEDYLKTIFKLEREQGKVATSALAKHLGVAPASVTGMLKKLSQMNLISYEPYKGVKLTKAGERIAVETLRHHRLIEQFLAEALNMPWDKVHEEAHKWEHILSDDLEDRIDAYLNSPKTDPHGAPIPDRNGVIFYPQTLCLADIEPGKSAVILEVNDHDAELLRYLGEKGLYPNVRIDVIDIEPFEGPLHIRVGESTFMLGRKAASHIFVTDVH